MKIPRFHPCEPLVRAEHSSSSSSFSSNAVRVRASRGCSAGDKLPSGRAQRAADHGSSLTFSRLAVRPKSPAWLVRAGLRAVCSRPKCKKFCRRRDCPFSLDCRRHRPNLRARPLTMLLGRRWPPPSNHPMSVPKTSLRSSSAFSKLSVMPPAAVTTPLSLTRPPMMWETTSLVARTPKSGWSSCDKERYTWN